VTARPAPPALTPAPAELAALACATRPDLDPDDIRGAITALTTAGWHWARVQTAVIVMCNRGEHPSDLRAAARTTRTSRTVTTT
jgi:hypothetical protein